MSGRGQGTVLPRRIMRWWIVRAADRPAADYSTVTDLARLRGLSMSRPSANAVW
jgi:hypothetical protein